MNDQLLMFRRDDLQHLELRVGASLPYLCLGYLCPTSYLATYEIYSLIKKVVYHINYAKGNASSKYDQEGKYFY